VWTGYLRAAWVHEFSPDRSITAAFNVAPGFFFNTIGTPAAVDTAQFTAGGNLALTRNVSLFGNFTGVFGKSTQVYSGLGGLRLSW
jgi:outer membrane autotransporter protein